MTESLEKKIKEAEQSLRLASSMSDYYYHKPLIVCYSGGKDSDVLLDIAMKCLKPNEFEVLNSHTTVDAPETVYHIRKVFHGLEELGIKTTIKLPTDNGEVTSMWKIIERYGVPNRIQRICCYYLKETSTPKRMAAMGVRKDESKNREGRDTFAIRSKKKSEREYRSTSHTYAMFELDKTGKEDAYECEMIRACKKNKDTIVNPIYYFTEKDIWEYIKIFSLHINPLYEQGFSRIGCIGCPLAGVPKMKRDFEKYPIYKANYQKAFERMVKRRKETGKKCPWNNGEEVMRWWLGENPNQVRIEDLLKERNEDNG